MLHDASLTGDQGVITDHTPASEISMCQEGAVPMAKSESFVALVPKWP